MILYLTMGCLAFTFGAFILTRSAGMRKTKVIDWYQSYSQGLLYNFSFNMKCFVLTGPGFWHCWFKVLFNTFKSLDWDNFLSTFWSLAFLACFFLEKQENSLHKNWTSSETETWQIISNNLWPEQERLSFILAFISGQRSREVELSILQH